MKHFSLILVTCFQTWTTPGSCVQSVVTCESSPSISNGVVLPGGNQVGSTRQVQCNSGYEGNFAIHCSENGEWSIGGSCNRGSLVLLLLLCYQYLNL